MTSTKAARPFRPFILIVLGYFGIVALIGKWKSQAWAQDGLQSARMLSADHGDSSHGDKAQESIADKVAHATGEHEHMTAKIAKIAWPGCFFIMSAIVVATLVHNPCSPHVMHLIPESLVFIVVGACWACIGEIFMNDKKGAENEFLELFTTGNSVTLNLFLLPIIIFESGWSLNHKDFFHQFLYILIFAIGGTLIAWSITGSLLVLTGSWGWHPVTCWRTALTYSALISAVDPVASLATYAALKVEPLLNISVFGESTINDAVAIALFLVFNNEDSAFEGPIYEIFGIVFLKVCWKLFASIALGVAVGFVIVLIFRFTEMNHSPSLEALLLLLSSFFIFALAEYKPFGMSGIIAVLFGGIFLGMFARPHLSVEGSFLTSYLLKQLASLADMCVFLITGFSVLTFKFAGGKGFILGLLVIIFCIIGRAAAVFPLGAVVNKCKRCLSTTGQSMNLLDFGRLFMMFWAGLRGGIALVLTLELRDFVAMENKEPDMKAEFRTATFCVIVFFLVSMGSTTEMLLKYFNIPMGPGGPTSLGHSTNYNKVYGGYVKLFSSLLVGTERLQEYNDQAVLLEGSDIYEALTSKAWGTKKVALHKHQSLLGHTSDVGLAKEALDEIIEGDDDESTEATYTSMRSGAGR